MLRDGNWAYCDHFVINKNIKSLPYIPATNKILYTNYNSIKKKITDLHILNKFMLFLSVIFWDFQ